MRRLGTLILSLVLTLSAWGLDPGAAAQNPKAPPPAPADCKLVIAFYGVDKLPITSAELVVRSGIAYYFAKEAIEEVLILDPAAARIEFLDLDRRLQSEIALTRLDEKLALVRRALVGAIRKHEEAGGRGDRLAAEMSRALIDPALAATYDPDAHRVRLTSPVVTVDATGEPEPDAARLALFDHVLTVLIKLAAVRDPEAIPPYIRLEALHALTAGHHLRPAELAFIYRLAGPPRKHRWTYRLVDTLTAREAEAIRRIILIREHPPHVPFEQYEQRTTETKTKTKATP